MSTQAGNIIDSKDLEKLSQELNALPGEQLIEQIKSTSQDAANFYEANQTDDVLISVVQLMSQLLSIYAAKQQEKPGQ